MNDSALHLKYGCNPHQAPARIYVHKGVLPLKVLNGAPGYINMLDALNSWQLVRELSRALNMPAAASFKHVSPAGAAVATDLDNNLRKVYFVDDLDLSPAATAYARARGADRMSSFGDWAAISEKVDVSTARLLRREVSDGIIAPGYDPKALEMLCRKKNGMYPVVIIDPSYESGESESREVFGITFEQKRNNARISTDLLKNIVTENKAIPDNAKRDLVTAMVALKYTQSNSVCLALDGQVIGIGAGQQSRIHCTRLAASKADQWWLRQHRSVLDLPFRSDIKRPDKNNAINQFLRDDLSETEEEVWKDYFDRVPERLTGVEKRDWFGQLHGVSLASDAFFPFRDNIDRAAQSGVSYIAQTGGSVADDIIVEACNDYGMVMAITGLRLFHH